MDSSFIKKEFPLKTQNGNLINIKTMPLSNNSYKYYEIRSIFIVGFNFKVFGSEYLFILHLYIGRKINSHKLMYFKLL